MIGILRKLAKAEQGATAVEYGLLLTLIALTALGAITNLGTEVTNMWGDIRNEVVRD